MVGKKVKRAEFIEKYSILDDLKYDIFLLEPTHEMYLNLLTSSISPSVASLEPTHEMYLNTKGNSIHRRQNGNLNRHMRCI